ncbi:MAG: DUF4350 domain-containing protein, partial [Ferruginibacter sp.]
MTLLTSCGNKNAVKLPSLRETYTKNDKRPFGASIAYSQLDAMFTDNVIRDIKQPFTKTWPNISDTAAVYICITSKLFVNEEEVDAMLEFIEAGNDLVISAGRIDEILLERIGCNQVYADLSVEEMLGFMEQTKASSLARPGSYYSYYYYPFRNYFEKIDSSKTKVLGYNNNKHPNSIVYFHGRGRLFLQCEPRALSNYFLLKENNYQYLQHVLAYTHQQPDHVYWDDYYNKLLYRKKGKNDNAGFSTFSEIMKHPPLQYAFWIALALLLLYIFFGGKRTQRIIEEVKPNENTTVTFTETIGRLYLQKKDNKNIADKMVTYFNEYIRNTYFLNSNHVNDDFVTVLSRKSGVEKEKVDTLYRSIAATQS